MLQLVNDRVSNKYPSSKSKVVRVFASLSVNDVTPFGTRNVPRFLIDVGNNIPVIAVPFTFTSLSKGELFNLSVPPNAEHPLKLTLDKYLFGDKFALFEFISVNNVALVHSNSTSFVALPISIELGFMVLIPLIRLILEPP